MEKKIRALLTLVVYAVILYTGLTASTTVSVSAAAPIRSTINMARTKNVTVVKGNRYRMKAVIKEKIITTQGKWISSNKKVATVTKNGVIKAIKAGKTTIKATYKGRSLKTVVKVRSVCKHTWKTTKKATCGAKGTKICSVCGTTASIAKTAHKYVTDTWTGVEGRGKVTYAFTMYCNGCNIDMTGLTNEQMGEHTFKNRKDIESVLAGTVIMKYCFGGGWHGADGEARYPKYMMTHLEETYCKTCGARKDKTITNLYEVYYDEWRNVVRKSDGKILEETIAYKNHKAHIEALEKLAALNGGKADSEVILAVMEDPEVILDVINGKIPVTEENAIGTE